MKKLFFAPTMLMASMAWLLSGCGAKSDGFAPSSFADPGTISFSVASYNYGAAVAGQIVSATLNVLHVGGTVTNVSGTLASPFKFKGGNFPGVGGTCGTNISSNCTIVVNFEPVASGSFNTNLGLNYTSVGSTYSVAIPLSGSATLPNPTDLLITGSSSVQINQCVAFVLNSVVLPNINSPVTSNTTVNLAVNSGTGTFYSDIGCSIAITSKVITSGNSSATVYFRSTSAPQTPTLVSSAASLQSGTKVISVTNVATKLAIAAPTQIQTDDCRQITISRQDASNLAVSSLSSVNVNVSSNGGGQVYSDSACTTTTSSASIASGASSVSVYVKDSTIETITLNATDQAGSLTAASKNIDVVNSVNWWNTGYQKRIQINIDNSDQNTTFTNQPVLIRLNSSVAGYSNFKSDGSDIRFVASDNSTNLDFEVESWDVNGNSYVWVRIPTVAASTTTTIFMYFDNPSATLGQNPTSLWTRYQAVWHLEESASGTAPQFKDSTATGKHGTAVNGPTTAPGIIGNALSFGGNYDSMDVGSLISTLGGTATLSYWIKTNQTGNNTNYLAPGVTGVEEQGGVNDIFWGWFDASGFIAVTAGNGTGAKSNLAINDNVWRHITITRNATDGAVSFYVNGVLNNSGTSGVGNITTDFSKFGVIPSTAGPGQEFDGTLDEIRITNTILSAAQVKAEFKFQNNQNNSNVSFGSIESSP